MGRYRSHTAATERLHRLVESLLRLPEQHAVSVHQMPSRPLTLPCHCGYALTVGCSELELDVVWVAELQDVDAKRRQVRHLSVHYPALVQEPCGLFDLLPAVDAEAELIEPDAILVKAVALRRDGTQPQEQGAFDQDHAPEQDAIDSVVRGIVGRWHLRRHVEPEQAGVERAGTIHVGHGKAQMMDSANGNRLGHAGYLRR